MPGRCRRRASMPNLCLSSRPAGKMVSQNGYDIAVATQAWAMEGLPANADKIAVFDPAHQSDKALKGLPVETNRFIG